MSVFRNKKLVVGSAVAALMIIGDIILLTDKTMEKLFHSELDTELRKYGNAAKLYIAERDIVALPLPVQKYFRYCGYIGREKARYAQVHWEDFYLKMAPDKDWTQLDCMQYNFIDEPARLVHMKTKVLGILPFEGRDKFQDGHGNMLIIMMKIFKLGDSKGKEMDDAALVTILAESLLIPSYALQPYITWTPIDEHSAKASITFGAIQISGVFYFNDLGACIRFDTDDRYFTEKDGSYTKTKWSAVFGAYGEKDGIKLPSNLTGIWLREQGDFEYVKGRIAGISYDF